MATLLRFILVRLNRKLDEGMSVEATEAGAVDTEGQFGIPAEGGKRGFRYRV
jgi:hypothetical protein